MSGEPIPYSNPGWRFPMDPKEWVCDFIEAIDHGDIPGVPSLRERSQQGYYQLIWRGEVLNEQSPFLREMEDEELLLVFVNDE